MSVEFGDRDCLAALASLSRRRFLFGAGAGCFTLLSNGARAEEAAGGPSASRFMMEWGEKGKEPGQFDVCVGLAVTKNDEIYTAEFQNQRVQKFTPEGRFISSFPVQPHAGGLAVDEDGVVYVGHWNSNKVAAYSPTGEMIREWGGKGTEDGKFQLPGSVSLGPDGLLYVPDQGNSRIQKFTRQGEFVGKWGSLGSEPGQFGGPDQSPGGRFAGPQFVAFDGAGNVYATDAALCRVTKFTSEGQVLAYWGSGGEEPGGFGPQVFHRRGPGLGGCIGIAVDREDRVWVSSTNGRVQRFSNNGEFQVGLGGEGSEPGLFNVPHALGIDSKGCLYVADSMNHRIQKFRGE